MAKFNASGLVKLGLVADALRHADATPLMIEWAKIIEQDNRKGLLAGQDKDGKPMVPVSYRPKGAPLKLKKHQKPKQFAGGVANNLTPAEYRRLAGPPLVPRGMHSRLITNLFLAYKREPAAGGGWIWRATGAWRDIVSAKGVPFMEAHFLGRNNLPVRDPRGVRPWGRNKALAALKAWAASLLKKAVA
jgi:hypothetical protein